MTEVNPGLSDFAAKERIDEAVSTGADALVTACPWCRNNFEAAGGIEVTDILDLVAEAMK